MTTEHEQPGSAGPAQPARPRSYKVLIDKTQYDIPEPTPTGRELLIIAAKQPPEQFAIYLKSPGQQPIRIDLDKKVDLREPGVERFVTLPLDQTEG